MRRASRRAVGSALKVVPKRANDLSGRPLLHIPREENTWEAQTRRWGYGLVNTSRT